MTTTLEPTAPAAPVRATVETRRQGLGRAIHSEWIKIRSLRATWVWVAAVVAVMIGLGAIASAVSTGEVATPQGGADPFAARGPLSVVLVGADFAVLLVGVLGCLTGAREYGSRMISATVAAVPRRWQVVAAKAVVLTAVVLPMALVGVFGAYAVGTGILSGGGGATASLADGEVLRSVLGMAGYITAIALIGLGLGVLLRGVGGSIAAVVGGVMVLPAIAAGLLPDSWDPLLRFLPSSAASAFTTVMGAGTEVLAPAAGAAVLVGWVVLVLGAATAAITRRDV